MREERDACAECGYPENSLAHSLTFGTYNGNHAFVRPTSPPAEPTRQKENEHER